MDLALPTRLTVATDGTLGGATRRYTKLLGDLDGVYRDNTAWQAAVAEQGAESIAYAVDDHRYPDQAGGTGRDQLAADNAGALIVGTSTLQPGIVGDEYAMTRGHLHAIADRAELYHCLSGHGVMLLETVDGHSETVELRPGEAVNVPGHWIHRSVNVGDEPFVTLFCYAADAGQDYGIIADAGGMRSLIVRDGDSWAAVPNPDHIGYRADGKA
ncbi:glucose-6-phosphate isomerase family protein [Microlunatus soli]|uniref:glucose-6-phosphate isomerase n=1 Tax=Microlunatus soli TaxID=630515 RepID=A0A1H1PY31_9ACTN|nr:glucose-6-phosphate isomerase family protein [Microlunatus soli]SDS15599.1 glucose-6-phosphate isomerase [Microlunatus soli]